MSREILFQETLQALEWPKLLEILAAQAHSVLGADFCRALPLADTFSLAQKQIQETAEMIAISESLLPFPVLNFDDSQGALTRAGKGAALDAKELRNIANAIDLIMQVRRCLMTHQDLAPNLFSCIDHIDNLSFLKTEVDQCISREGEILDHASSTLYDAIQMVQGLKTRIRQRLESMITSSTYREVLQEPYFAQRGNRYVLPIKVDMQHQVHGIVHDVSSSGLTVFLEPRELIELNNRIKVEELEVDREVQRILKELTTIVVGSAKAVQLYFHLLVIFDSIGAKARLSQRMQGLPVELSENGHIHLMKARHPLLMLTREQVIPNDIVFQKGQRILVISGPNTGGKTVNLKLLGLYSLMVRAGLHLPCAEGSEMGFFPQTYADIGDMQDLAKDLSSFSAHLTKIIELLDIGVSQEKQSSDQVFVLLDEVIGSTDPSEGAALAEAVLLYFAKLGFKVVVTTHYNSLKTLALSMPEFLNASLEFDVATLTPTYRLIQGIPGGSSALAIAGCLGMDPSILNHATDLVHQQDRQLDHIFSELQDMHHRVSRDLESAEINNRVADEVAKEAQGRVDHLRATEHEELRKIKRKFKEEMSRARTEIRQTLDALKEDKTLIKVREAKERVHAIEAELNQQTQDPSEIIPFESLRAGALVEISNLGTSGILLENPQGKKRVRLQVGDSELSVGVELLIGKKQRAEEFIFGTLASSISSKKKSPKELDGLHHPSTTLSGLLTIDLRGQIVDDALDHLTSRLDEAVLTGAKSVHIIHGHGTGKLKMAIRQYLSNSPYSESFSAGREGEGGDGVTVVELK